MPAPVVTVLGSAELESAPDLATLTCTVHAKADAADAVRARLATASQQVTSVLAEFAVAVQQSSTTGLHVAPVFGARRATRVDHVAGRFSHPIVYTTWAGWPRWCRR